MRLRVDLLPHGNYPDVVLVIDTLRATTTAVTYLERGAEALLLTRTPEVALGLKGDGFLLGGERGGLLDRGGERGGAAQRVTLAEALVALGVAWLTGDLRPVWSVR